MAVSTEPASWRALGALPDVQFAGSVAAFASDGELTEGRIVITTILTGRWLRQSAMANGAARRQPYG